MLSAELVHLLESLVGGNRPAAVQITLFSDLARADVAELGPFWQRLPLDVRIDIVERAAALAEDNVDLDFTGLTHAAFDDDSPRVRALAVEAAWESRDRETARRIRTLLRDGDESVRAAAATGLQPFVLATELGEFDTAEGDCVVSALRDAWDSDESLDVRARALESLGARSLPWVETAISDAYYAHDERLRMAAIRAMGLSAQERWVEYLEESAVSDDPQARFQVALSLGAIGSEFGIEILGGLLADEDAEVVEAAVSALGQVGGEDAVDRLTQLAHDVEDGPLREAIDEAIEAAKYADTDPPDLLRSRIGL